MNSNTGDNLPGPGSEMFGGGSAMSETDPATGQSSDAAAIGLSNDEFSHMLDTPNNGGGTDPSTGASSEAASIGLSDDEYNNMMNSMEHDAANLGQPASGMAYDFPAGPAPSSGASDASSVATNDFPGSETDTGGDGSVDMGATTSTDVTPGFPGAEGTSSATASGYGRGRGRGRVGFHVAGPSDPVSAPPGWTDNGDGTATDPTNTRTIPYSQAWDLYNAAHAFDFTNPPPASSTTTSGTVGSDLNSNRPPPGWYSNQDGSATDASGTYTLDFSDAWDFYNTYMAGAPDGSAPLVPDDGAADGTGDGTGSTVSGVGDLSFSPLDAPPGWLDNGDGTVTNPETGETLSNDDAWHLVETGQTDQAGPMIDSGGVDAYGMDEDLDPNQWNAAWNDDDGYPDPTTYNPQPYYPDPSTYNLPYYPPNSPSPLNHNMGQFTSFGEYHGPTGAPIVRDQANRPYAVSAQGTFHAVQ